MRIARRHMLALAGGTWLSRVFAASLPGVNGRSVFEVDRLLSSNSAERGDAGARSAVRKYLASATVTLFSIPLVSKNSVGSGYAVVEEAGHTLAIQFGAGSYPESAPGLNRLGYIQEVVIEDSPGSPVECAWLAFMTTSQEKSLGQAKTALETSGDSAGTAIPYSASQGYGRRGDFASRVDRLQFPSRYTWRDITALVQKARAAMTAWGDEEPQPATSSGAAARATFLYTVRRAMLDTQSHTTACVVFNRTQFQFDARKEPDLAATNYFSARNLVPPSGSVMRMNALLTEKHTGEKTPFRLWYEADAGQYPPLRFEYQARSFLRLTFEVDPGAITPPIQFVFKTTKEAA
jgi:hypothetical protein